MKLAILAVLAAAAPALADPEPIAPYPASEASCARGAELAQAGDLPRAALYLEPCDTPAAAEVARKLRASQLSSISISTSPNRMTIESTAMPGAPLIAPVTLWAPAGTYKIRATTTDGIVLEQTIKVVAHDRATVLLTAPPHHERAPHSGKADFTDEPIDPPHQGSPPAVKHKSLLPCRYEGCETHGGEDLADPLASEPDFIEPHPAALRLGLRAGAAAAGHAGGSRIGPSLALELRAAAPWEEIDAHHPFEFVMRPLDWSRRGGDDAHLDVLGTSVGLSKVVADPDAAWISVGLAVRGEYRLGDAMDVRRFGLDGAATVELALRKLPVTVGARYEQGVTEMLPGVREHAVLIELGVDLRTFHHAR